MKASSIHRSLAACLLVAGTAVASANAASPPPELAAHFAAVHRADAIEDAEARCVAYPDLPGNRWAEGAARARCARLRTPEPSMAEIEALLREPGGAAMLEARFDALLESHYRDPGQREQIFNTFFLFDHTPTALAVAQRWVALAPQSPHAMTALARHHEAAGWEARGEAFIANTLQGQLDAMSSAFAKAVPLYFEAFRINPRLSPACHGLMQIGRQSSDALQQAATAGCMKADPISYHVVLELIKAARPRWGGSEEAIRQVVAYAAAKTADNPMLGALLGEAAGEDRELRSTKPSQVADRYAQVAALGPSGNIHYRAGLGFYHAKQPWPALVYLSQAVRLRPDESEWRALRGRLLYELDLYDEAIRELQAAVALAPADGASHYRLGQAVRKRTGNETLARPHYLRAKADPRMRRWAMRMHCQGLLVESSPDASACVDELLEAFPQEGEGWRLRAWLLKQSGDPAERQAMANFIKYADPTDPLHREIRRKMGIPFDVAPGKADSAAATTE
jgi:tetratricopeptide (TPR) repeat protein